MVHIFIRFLAQSRYIPTANDRQWSPDNSDKRGESNGWKSGPVFSTNDGTVSDSQNTDMHSIEDTWNIFKRTSNRHETRDYERVIISQAYDVQMPITFGTTWPFVILVPMRVFWIPIFAKLINEVNAHTNCEVSVFRIVECLSKRGDACYSSPASKRPGSNIIKAHGKPESTRSQQDTRPQGKMFSIVGLILLLTDNVMPCNIQCCKFVIYINFKSCPIPIRISFSDLRYSVTMKTHKSEMP